MRIDYQRMVEQTAKGSLFHKKVPVDAKDLT